MYVYTYNVYRAHGADRADLGEGAGAANLRAETISGSRTASTSYYIYIYIYIYIHMLYIYIYIYI